MIALAVKGEPDALRMATMNTYQTDSRGKRIAWARKQAGMTGAELARAVGVRNVTISYIENDKRDLSLPLLMKIAEVTGVTVGFLLRETEYPYRQDVPPEPEAAGISPEADEIARLVDDVPPLKRAEVLSVLRTMVRYAMEQERGEQEEQYPANPLKQKGNKRVISSNDSDFAQRLIHRDKVVQAQAGERTRS